MREIFRKYARFLVISCTIIVVQTNSITTDFFKRQPSSITVAYYKLNWNLNDSSWNNRNATQSWWTITYPNSKYARFSSWYAKFNNWFPNTWWTTDNITISLFARNISPSWWEANIFCVWQDWTWDWRWQILRYENWYLSMAVSKWSSWASQQTNSYNVSIWERHHLVWTYSPANRQMKFYIDWVLKQTVSIQATMRISSVSAIWKTWNYSHSLNWDVCEIINEKALRSDEYVAKYYNKYKNIFNYT